MNNHSQDLDDGDIPVKREQQGEIFANVVDHRLSRRDLIKKLGIGALFTSIGAQATQANKETPATPTTLDFKELERTVSDNLHVPENYQADVLIRWGDPLFSGLPDFNPETLTADEQLKRFGYNNDFVGFIPLPHGSTNSDHGLLAVNHEYSDARLMHQPVYETTLLTQEQYQLHMASQGMSVVEIKRIDGKWQVILDSKYNRRITPNTTMAITGPAAGHPRLKNKLSDGIKTWGTFANCSGSITPWGTVLSGEENIQEYFTGNPANSTESLHYWRLDIQGYYQDQEDKTYTTPPPMPWGLFDERFNLEKIHNGPLHCGWVIEVDPLNPNSTPKKRTALGRFRHEGCSITINKDNSVVAYTGDDQKFEYIYKFVSNKKYIKGNRPHNMTLLDEGTLSAARFKEDGKLIWVPLIHGNGPLTKANGFKSQADVCIDCRRAADLMYATPMDRPEDIEVNLKTNVVYAMLTNNDERDRTSRNDANPRVINSFGHIIEMTPPNDDHTADSFQWDIFILAGNPEKPDHEAKYHPDTTEHGWFMSPDNCAFDNQGRIWIATDGGSKFGIADGVWVSETTGPARALSKSFLQTPTAAELCGPFFTPDNSTFFCAVQHPGEGSDYNSPSTRWPDFNPNMPPRPSVVAIQKIGGGIVGT
ncbi:MAG: PhoX family protein [Akkermansiaceae bacterium]